MVGTTCSCRYPTKYKRTGPQENDLPLDVVWIDIDYMDSYKIFTNDPEAFPEVEVSLEQFSAI